MTQPRHQDGSTVDVITGEGSRGGAQIVSGVSRRSERDLSAFEYGHAHTSRKTALTRVLRPAVSSQRAAVAARVSEDV